MLKQILIISVLLLMVVAAYQIFYKSSVPIIPIKPQTDNIFHFQNNGAYIMLRIDQFVAGLNYEIDFDIKTTIGDGLIFTTGGPIVSNPTVPYIAIYLQTNILRFIHNGPKGGAVLLSDVNAVTNNAWHNVKITRANINWQMMIDGKTISKLTTESNAIAPSITFIGNRPVKTELPGVNGLVGCIRNVKLNGKQDLEFTKVGGVIDSACN